MSDPQKSQLSEDDKIKIWKQDAFQRQSYYCDMLGDRDWECYTESELDIANLRNKIGFAVFGSPKRNESGDQQKGDCEEDIKEDKEDSCSEKKQSASKENSHHIEEDLEKMMHQCFSNFFGIETTVLPKSDAPFGNSEKDSAVIDTQKNEESITKFMSLFNLETPSEIMMACSDDRSFPEDSIEDEEQQDDSQNPTDNDDGYEMHFNDEGQLKQIDDLIRKIKICCNGGKNNDIYIAFIFVIAKIDDFTVEFPIIRVRKPEGNANECPYFIDPAGRCYESWTDFLEDNFLPSCLYCYPKNGFYTRDSEEEVMVEFGTSPEASFTRKFCKYTDLNTSLVGFGCGLIAFASLFAPVTGPVVIASAAAGGSCGLWGTGRATYQLIERHRHKQDLFDREGRGCWLAMAAGIFGAASMGALNYTTYLAMNGKVLGKAASFLVNGVEITTIGVSGLNIFNQCYNMYESKEVTKLEAIELVLSLAFFCNSAIKLKTAQNILIEKQNEVLGGIESQLSRSQKKGFRKLVKSTANVNTAEGNASVIRTVKNLKDPKTYFKQLNSIRKMANKTKSSIVFSEDASGRILINEKVLVDPELINSMKTKTRRKVFNTSRQFNENKINYNKFNRDMKFISKKEQLVFQNRTFEFQKKMNVKTTAEFQLNGKKLFSAVKADDVKNIDELFVAIKNDKKTRPLLNEVMKYSKSSTPPVIILNILKMYGSIVEAKELYDELMKFYEDNLKDIFEKLVDDISEMIERMLNETCKEQKENCTKLKNIFFRSTKEMYFTPWDYFKFYLQKINCEVPESESVVIMPQKVGWLFFCDHPRVHSVFIASVIMSSDLEKITCIAMMKS